VQEMRRAQLREELRGGGRIEQIADVMLHAVGNLRRSRRRRVDAKATSYQRRETRSSHESRRTRDQDGPQSALHNRVSRGSSGAGFETCHGVNSVITSVRACDFVSGVTRILTANYFCV
jgi:hypothetical protein